MAGSLVRVPAAEGARMEPVHRDNGAGTRAVTPITAETQPATERLVGRDQELAALLALLDPGSEAPARVVVSGVAGVGKTALAWQAAQTAVGRGWFPGGAVIIDLHHDGDPTAQVAPERVYASLLRALDPAKPVADLPATVDEQASAYHDLMSHLEQVSRPVLLVVDNAEDINQITGLLPTGRAHRVLITSRHALKELPGARLLEVDVLASDLAVELLGSRRPGDTRLGAHPAAAAELARLCGYLPLALQIIAVLMADDPSRPTTELVKELADETARLPGAPGEWWAGRAALELANRRLDDTSARLSRLQATVPGGPHRPPPVETAQWSEPSRDPNHGHAPTTERRHLLRLITATALVIATAGTVFAFLRPFMVNADTGGARLVLSTPQIKIGDSYLATASGFSPGEGVRFSWTGPTDGVMGVFPADSSGRESSGPVFERHPPGNYTITVTGLTSGRSASAGLQVITGTGTARLVLSASEIKVGDSYFATAWGFSPGEDVRFSINRAHDVVAVFPADSVGSRWHRVVDKGPPGNYTVTATGLKSRRTASAGLKVIQPGN